MRCMDLQLILLQLNYVFKKIFFLFFLKTTLVGKNIKNLILGRFSVKMSTQKQSFKTYFMHLNVIRMKLFALGKQQKKEERYGIDHITMVIYFTTNLVSFKQKKMGN